MKTDELMQHDWVKLIGYEFFYQVEAIFYAAITIKTKTELLDVEIDKFEPIPITEEILKANNFVQDGAINEDDGFVVKSFSHVDHPNLWCYVEKDYIDFRIDEDMKCGICIHYVHELQHLLRFCNMNDLLINFKLG